VAVDAKSGDELWRVARDEKSNWTTPFVWRNKLRTEIVAAGGKAIRSYDPANGKLLWELKRPNARGPNNVSATPVGDDAMLYVGAGTLTSFGPLWAVKAGAAGDISLDQSESANGHIAWSSSNGGPPLASPLVYKDYLYALSQSSILACYEAKTGKEVYKERLTGGRSFTSSPWAHDGKVCCLDEDGKTFLVRAGPRFEVLGKNEIEDMFWASPAVARDALYLRGADYLYCIKQ
jgi:outer membrane protein assembly factor BamB